MRKTKIICTIGPASESEEKLRELMLAGMNVARFNFSHGSHKEQLVKYNRVLKVRKELGLPVATLLDTKGPEIRLRDFEGGKVELVSGQQFVLTTEEIMGTAERATISYKNLKNDINVGTTILIDDGLIELTVDYITDKGEIHTTVKSGGRVSNRKGVNAVISQRALREIYLRGFEIAIREAAPWTVMSSYNRLNGVYASQNRDLLTTVLRDEWGFDGMVMTDWFAGDDGVAQMKAGNDIIMGGFPHGHYKYHQPEILSALSDKTLDEEVLDRNIRRILGFVKKTPSYREYACSLKPDLARHAQVAQRAADEAMVLLKNDRNTLPVRKPNRVALFGKTSYDFIAGGTGSGEVHYGHAVSLKEGLSNVGFRISSAADRFYTRFVDSVFAAGGHKKYAVTRSQEPRIDKALVEAEAKVTDMGVVTLGRLSGEGVDRKEEGYFTLTDNEKELLGAVCSAYHALGKKVVVVLNIGGVIETASWKELPDAILLSWQTGQQGGAAVAELLRGTVNPSGKLPVSYPVSYADVPSSKSFPGIPADLPVNSYYNEGVYIGYRYYTTYDVPVSYPFGYGLSYTRFEYSDLTLSSDSFPGRIDVSVKISNTGKVAGKEVVQLYLTAPAVLQDKPERELKGFAKTRLLAPGESQVLTFTLDPRSLCSFRSGISSWVAEAGRYEVKIGASSQDIRQRASFTLGKELVVEKLHDVLAPNVPIKDMGTTSAKVLGTDQPFDHYHELDYKFNWHW